MKHVLAICIGLAVLPVLPERAYAADALSKCVDMAAFPDDPTSGKDGVPDHLVPMPLALSACRDAVAIAPDSATHLFLLGRTHVLAGDEEKGVGFLQQAEKKGYAAAAFLQGRLLYMSGDVEAAIEAHLRAAELGHPVSQLTVGTSYGSGVNGLPRDREQERYWLERARDGGNFDAAALLAKDHLDPGSAAFDPELALERLEAAVAAGSTAGKGYLALAQLTAPSGDKELGKTLLMEQMRLGDTSALILYIYD